MLPIYIFRPQVLERYRINPKPLPYAPLHYVWSFIRVVIFNNVIIAPVAFAGPYFHVRVFRRAFPLYIHGMHLTSGVIQWSNDFGVFDLDPSRFPTYATMAWSLFGAMAIEDALFYWSHRALHTPWLYKRIHKVCCMLQR